MLPNLGNIGQQTFRSIIAVPLNQYSETRTILNKCDFDGDSITERTFLSHQLVVSYNAKTAREPTLNRRKQIEQIERHEETLLTKLEVFKGRTPNLYQKAVNKVNARTKKLNLSHIFHSEVPNYMKSNKLDSICQS